MTRTRLAESRAVASPKAASAVPARSLHGPCTVPARCLRGACAASGAEEHPWCGGPQKILEDSGFREDLVHYRPRNSPSNPNHP